MVGAPISYSGNQPGQPSAPTGAPPPQMYATPSSPISTLLPYNGGAPPSVSPYPDTTSSAQPLNTSYLYGPPNPAASPYPPANPPTSASYPASGAAPPPPFPPCSTGPANPYPQNPVNTSTANYPPVPSAPPPFAGGYQPNPGVNQQPPAFPPPYPPAGYPPQPNNPHQAPTGYPTGQPTGNYAPPTSTYPPANPTGQAPPYSTPTYSAPPPAGGVYPTPPPTGGVYPPQY